MTPLAIPFAATVFVLVAHREWSRSLWLSRVALGCAAALAVTVVRFPGEGTGEVLDHTDEGIAYLFAIARGLGLACAMQSALGVLRELIEP